MAFDLAENLSGYEAARDEFGGKITLPVSMLSKQRHIGILGYRYVMFGLKTELSKANKF